MPPKAKGSKRASTGTPPSGKKVKTPSRASQASKDAVDAAASQAAEATNMCGSVLRTVHEALKTIMENPVFQGIVDVAPLSIADGGMQDAFQQEKLVQAIGRDPPGHYTCAANFFWQNFTWLANHRVPINRGQIKELQRFSLKPLHPPMQFTFSTVMAVDGKDFDVSSAQGALQRLSPPEPTFAVIMSIKEAIDKKADDQVLMSWRKLCLTAPFRFEMLVKGEARYWRSQNIRQEVIEMGQTAALSVRQWVYDVVGFKLSKEAETNTTLGALQVAKFYDQHMQYAGGTEHVSKSFVDSAITVHNRVLTQQVACKWLEWCEENLFVDNPWGKSVYTLQALVDRAQTASRISWAVWGLTDLYRSELITMGEFTPSKMRDYRNSYVEVLNMKLALRDELLEQWLPSSGLPIHHVRKMQEVFADFDAVRKFSTSYPGEPPADTTWMVGWPQSSLLAVSLIEEMVYTIAWDGRFRDAIKSKLKIADFLGYESVKADMDEVLTQLKNEREAKKGAGTDSTTTASAGQTGTTTAPAGSAGSTGPESSTPATTGWESLQDTDKEYWDKHMDKQIRTYIQYITEKKSVTDLEVAIRESSLAMMRGDPTGLVLYHYDVKLAGEPQTRPELRISPLRDASYHRLVRAVLNARSPAGSVATQGYVRSGEVAVILDGGRKGNINKLIAPWKVGTAKDQVQAGQNDEDNEDEKQDGGDEDESGASAPGFVASILALVYTEESVLAKRQRLRSQPGTGSVQQGEWAHILAHNRISLPDRKRKNFPGTTAGDTIYGIALPELASEWHLSWKVKKEVYGKKESHCSWWKDTGC